MPQQFKSVPLKLNPSFLASQPVSSLRTLIILLSTTNSSLVLQDSFFLPSISNHLIFTFCHFDMCIFFLHSTSTSLLPLTIFSVSSSCSKMFTGYSKDFFLYLYKPYSIYSSQCIWKKKFSKMENIIMPFSCLKSFNTPISYSGKKTQTH